MSDSVTPVEEIRAAIERLTRLRDERGYFEFSGYLCEESLGDTARSYLEPDQSASPITNDELMLVTFRMIDPVLAILEDAAIPYPEDGLYYIGNEMLALARSILTPATNGEPE